ncbi:hypothetical protein [Humibacter ginsenosidimutans]|uniref:Uncharacterized protein n=1 Tax=Humibacter ginsenosidimutans TaxID=2599293 RepID=A0A5B8M1I0_9MICO|nr:hypothetical protein [Humibacter ginsenosidimutans]QDZ13550.1 hypothetical protein FPZ11_00890 [Humibacter ginsenosidimutans]
MRPPAAIITRLTLVTSLARISTRATVTRLPPVTRWARIPILASIAVPAPAVVPTITAEGATPAVRTSAGTALLATVAARTVVSARAIAGPSPLATRAARPTLPATGCPVTAGATLRRATSRSVTTTRRAITPTTVLGMPARTIARRPVTVPIVPGTAFAATARGVALLV